MTQNLKDKKDIKDNKTDIIYLASSHCVKSLNASALQMGASSITPNGSVKKSHQYAELPTTILRTSTV